jgi:D-beta-D-heptose 7-phosphate kinase/D-beta-D-heptose 1-phosphate adenosyltransferase
MKILLLGDSCYDIYHYGEVKRISPEAPIPIFDLKYSEKKYGMASNVYENLKALGADVHIHTNFKEIKNRYIDIKSKQQLLRVDEKNDKGGFNGIMYDLIHYDTYDAIVISDYGKGFFKREDYEILRENFEGPIFIDTKDTYLDHYEGAIVKINQHEYEKAGPVTKIKNLIVTYGGTQVIWYKPSPDAPELFFPPKVEAHDVCGAGDTFLAALAIKYLETDSMDDAIRFAMKAAAVTVKHIGVYAPTREEIENGN